MPEYADDEVDLESLYATYLSPTRLTDRIDEVGSQVKVEIEEVMSMIDSAAGSASSYSESLVDMSEKIHQSKDRKGLRTIVESLVHTAKEMEASNIKLEERLNASKRKILDLHAHLEALRSESLTDPLTQLSNRKFFDSTLEKAIEEARAKNEALSLMLTDIDHFKNFNDSFGHLSGDQVFRPDGVEAERQGSGHCRPLRRRGIRRHPSEHGTALGDHGRRSHPPRRDDQGIDEALDRGASRPSHGVDRGRNAA